MALKGSPQKVIVLLSGGIDSACCLHFMLHQGYETSGLFIDFGQPSASIEYEHALEIAKSNNCRLESVDISFSPDQQKISSGEIVGRNSFLVSTAYMLSRNDYGLICLGIHSGTPYYDCSPAFFESQNRLISEQSDGKCSLVAPFLTWSKQQVYAYARKIGLPFEATYSCENGVKSHCGVCSSCLDRELYWC